MAKNNINIVIRAGDKASKPLRAVSDEMDKGSGKASKFRSALGSLGGMFAKTTLAAGALALAAGTAGATIGFQFNSSVEQSQAKLMAFMKNNERVAKTLTWVKQEAAATQFSFTEMADAAANLTPVAKSSGKSLESLVKQAEVLAALNPAEGLTGATFSLREALSGDWVSIVDRFNLPRKRIMELKQQGVPAMEIISRTLKEMGIDYGLVAKQGQTVSARFDQVKDKLTMMAGAATKPIFDRVSKELDNLGSYNYQKLGEEMAGVVGGGIKSIDEFIPKLQKVGKEIGDYLVPKLAALWQTITGQVVPALKSVVTSEFAQFMGKTLVFSLGLALDALNLVLGVISNFAMQTRGATWILAGLAAGFVSYQAIVGAVALKTTALTASQAALNAVMKLNPYALVAGVAIGIVSAYAGVISQTDNTKSATDRLRVARDNLRNATDAARDAERLMKDALLNQEGATIAVDRAQRNYNETVRQYGPKSLEAREAAYNLRRAKLDLKDAEEQVRKKTDDATKKQNEQKDAQKKVQEALNGTKDAAYRAAGGYAQLAANIQKAREQDRKTGKIGVGKNEVNAIFGMPKHALGTSYAPGGTTLLGEHGPELVKLPRGSQVTPAWQTRSQGASEGNTYITISGNISIATPEASDAFWNRVDKTQRLAKVGMA